MPENTNDVADLKNQYVETINSMKLKMEKIEQENKAYKEKEEAEKVLKAKQAEENKWQKEIEDTKKMIEDLKKTVLEKKDDTKVSKGVVSNEISPNEQIISELDKVLPAPKVEPQKFASRIARMMHYKTPTSKFYTHEQLGMSVNLQAGLNRSNPELIPANARVERSDILIRNLR